MKKLKESELKYYPDEEDWKVINREAKYHYGSLEEFSKQVMGITYVSFYRKCNPGYKNYLSHIEFLTIKRVLNIEFKLH